MSMLQANDGDHMSYVDIAAILQAEGSAPVDHLHELWSRLVFNMCVYNVDNHLRNHGFLREPLTWLLSPVYDLENFHPTEKEPYLHTGIMDDLNTFDLNNVREAAEFFRFRKAEAQNRLAEMRESVSYWKQEAAVVRAPSTEIRLMRDAFEYL